MRSAIALLLLLACAGCDRQNAAPEQGSDTAAAPKAVAAEPAGTPDRSHKGEAAPAIPFQTPEGAETTLAAFKGKPVLVNLWATWCAPCVAEMPTLDALAAKTGETLTVLTISQDLEPEKVPAFMAEKGYKRLGAYTDAKLGFSTGYQANLPTTILYDAQGRELWRIAGGMDWTSKAAWTLVGEAL